MNETMTTTETTSTTETAPPPAPSRPVYLNQDQAATLSLVEVARVAYGAFRAYAAELGEDHGPWDERDEAYRLGLLVQVQRYVEHPSLSAEDAHGAWLQARLDQGWDHGVEKDAEARTHPLMVPWPSVPPAQKIKGEVIRAVALCLAPLVVR
jgi:hypothetical protein